MLVSAVLSPLSLFRLPRKTWFLLIAYFFAAGLVMWGAKSVLSANEEAIRSAILSYIFPDGWEFAADFILNRFLASQQRLVLINAVITGLLMLVTVSLFWLKEMVSASFESEGKLCSKPVEEHPLWEQAWQEVKLLLLFLAVQGTIFWIGYQPSKVWKSTAVFLSYFFLFFTFAIDFVSPIFQRHLGHYSRIIKTLARHWPASLAFGAIFAGPSLFIGWLWHKNPEWKFSTIVTIVVVVNIIAVGWAAVAGTWLGSKMMPTFDAMKRSSVVSRILAWLVVLTLLVGNGYTFGSLALALHHKSQILKCNYSVVFSSFRPELPGLLDLRKDRIPLGIHFKVDIENPTDFDVTLEDNRLEILHDGDLIAESSIDPVSVPAKTTKRQKVGLTIKLAPSMALKATKLADFDRYKIVLWIKLAPGFEMPFYIHGYDDK